MQHNPLDFDGMLDRVTAGEEPLSDSLAMAAMTKLSDAVHPSHRASKRTDITLITKDGSSRPTTIETDGNVPEVLLWNGIFFKLNLGLGKPYLYLEIYGVMLSDIEVKNLPTRDKKAYAA